MPRTSSPLTTLSTTYKMRTAVVYSTIISVCAITSIAILTQKAIYFTIFALLLTPLITSTTHLLLVVIDKPITIDYHKSKTGATLIIEERPVNLSTGWGKASEDFNWN